MHLVTYEHRAPTERGGVADHSMGEMGLGFEAFEWTPPGARRLGALVPLGPHAGDVIDLNRAIAVELAGHDVGAPEAEADSLLPPDMLRFLQRLPASWEAAQRAFEFAADALERYDAPDLVRAGVVEARRRVRLCAPVPRPGKIVGVADGRGPRAEEPTLYLEAPSAVIGPEDEILLPAANAEVDYAGGLAAVIGRRARGVTPDEALACVAGYCVVNDVCARDHQDREGRLFIGRSCDTFAPMGPALVTVDEIPDPQGLAIRTVLSGTVVQNGSTKELAFPVASIVSAASKRMTLEPGDVILTGTPAGVGAEADPPRWLRDGDLVDVEIERIGRLRNYVRHGRPDRVD